MSDVKFERAAIPETSGPGRQRGALTAAIMAAFKVGEAVSLRGDPAEIRRQVGNVKSNSAFVRRGLRVRSRTTPDGCVIWAEKRVPEAPAQ